MKVGVFLCTCNDTCNMDFKKIKKAIEREVEFVEIHRQFCQKDGLAYLIDGIRRKKLDTLVITCDLKQDFFEDLNLGEVITLNIRELCGWVHSKKDATEKAISMIKERLFMINVEKPKRIIKETGNRVLIIGNSKKSFEIADGLKNFAEVTLFVDKTPEIEIPNVKTIFGSITQINRRSIRYRPNPIDEKICILCGECNKICEEKAIEFNKRYFITEKCTKCGKCIQICPTNAIKFERNEKELKTDHILVEDEISSPKLFDLLAKIGEAEVFKYIDANLENCPSFKSMLEGCSLCIEACPNDVIYRDKEGIKFDDLYCTGCGICSSICPLSLLELVGDPVMERLKILLDNKLDKKILLISCDEKRKELYKIGRKKTKYPAYLPLFANLGRISEVDLLEALLYGADGIIIWGCEKCLEELDRTKSFEIANAILQNFGLESRIRVVKDFKEIKDIEFTKIKHKKIDLSNKNKRERLIIIVKELMDLFKSKKLKFTGEYPFAEVKIGEECTFCDACISMCATDALKKEGDKLTFSYPKCIACTLCEKACPENAIKIEKVLDVEKLSNENYLPIYEAELIKCKKCGKPFTSKKILDKILALKIDMDRELLYYCEDCRAEMAVRKMIEENAQRKI